MYTAKITSAHMYDLVAVGAVYPQNKVCLQGHTTGKYPPVASTSLSSLHGTEVCPPSSSPTPISGKPAACYQTLLCLGPVTQSPASTAHSARALNIFKFLLYFATPCLWHKSAC